MRDILSLAAYTHSIYDVDGISYFIFSYLVFQTLFPEKDMKCHLYLGKETSLQHF